MKWARGFVTPLLLIIPKPPFCLRFLYLAWSVSYVKTSSHHLLLYFHLPSSPTSSLLPSTLHLYCKTRTLESGVVETPAVWESLRCQNACKIEMKPVEVSGKCELVNGTSGGSFDFVFLPSRLIVPLRQSACFPSLQKVAVRECWTSSVNTLTT